MGSALSGLGNLLIAVSVGGAAFLAFGPSPEELIHGRSRAVAPAAQPAPASRPAPGLASVPFGQPAPIAQRAVESAPASEPAAVPAIGTLRAPDRAIESLPITRVAIPSIGLDAEVVTATFVEKNGGTTWEIPKFKAGHAEYTAGAGDKGNAVLLGHVSSLRSGDVFKDLDQVSIDDTISVFSGDREFKYKVTEIKTVPREDRSMAQTTETPSVTLFTCTGTWLPTIWDYTERLAVRAELFEAPPLG